MRHSFNVRAAQLLVMLFAAVACGGGGSDSDWYYHWSCNGDSECLATNPTGQASGTLNEGPDEQSCTPLLTFAAHFWGAAATNSCDHDASGNAGTVAPALTSLVVTPATATLAAGRTLQLTATGHYSDGTTKDLTAAASWSVAGPRVIGDPVVLTVGGGGLVSALSTGTKQVQATSGSLSGSATIAVVAGTKSITGIVVAPANPTLQIGAGQQFTATASYSDGSTADITSSAVWSSSATQVAAFNIGHLIAPGRATAVAAGSTTIAATSGGVSGSTQLTVEPSTLVSIAVLPANPTIAAGLDLQFTAQGTFSNGATADISGQATWTSGTAAVASVGSAGLAHGIAPGTSLIRAAVGAVSGSTTLTVGAVALQSISVAPVDPTVTQGRTQQLTATGHYSDGSTQDLTAAATWHSATPAVAAIDAGGVVTAAAPGSSAMTAASGGKSGTTTVTVVALGAVWQPQPSGTTNALNAVAFCNNLFVAVGDAGTILTSSDGSTWTPRSSGTSSALLAVGCSPSLIVAAGATGALVTSVDGAAWTVKTPSGATAAIRTVAWNGSAFFVGGDFGFLVGAAAGVGDMASSADLTAWTMRDTSFGFTVRSLVWSGAGFMAVGDAVQASADGVTWANPSSTQPLHGGAWTGATFALVGTAGLVYLTTDGANFTFPQSQTSTLLNGVVFSGGQLTAVGNAGTVITSPDGSAWTLRSSQTSANLLGVAGSGSKLVAVGASGTLLLSK